MDSAAAQQLYTAIKAAPQQWKTLTDNTNSIVQADSSRFELDQLPKHTAPALQAGMITMPLLRSEDQLTNFIYVLELLPGNSPRSFEEAKGLVLNDYQNQLEDAWIKSLKKKYPVRISKSVLDSLNR
jgi:peptidyl-prolyl cis-trans isomerase SurA